MNPARIDIAMTAHRASVSLARNGSGCHHDRAAIGDFVILSATRWLLLFLQHWMRFAFRDAVAGTFGWASIPSGAVVLGSMRYFGLQMSPSPQWNEVLIYALTGAGAAWFIGFAYHSIFSAPRKAYLLMEPFSLSVDDIRTPPEFSNNDKFKGHAASIVVKNRSSDYLLDCKIRISNIAGVTAEQFPRFVERFDLPPYSERVIVIAYWFSRTAPYYDDDMIGVAGPVSAGVGGNLLRIPMSEHFVSVEVYSAQSQSKQVQFRLWPDPLNRTLRAKRA